MSENSNAAKVVDWSSLRERASMIADPAIRYAITETIERDAAFDHLYRADSTFIRDRFEDIERKLDAIIAKTAAWTDRDDAPLMREIQSMRTTMALSRAAALSSPAPVDMTATGKFASLNLQSAEHAIASLPIWKAKPAAVGGFISAALVLGVTFGVHLDDTQQKAIVGMGGALFLALAGLAQSWRAQKTTNAIVNAAISNERNGSPSVGQGSK